MFVQKMRCGREYVSVDTEEDVFNRYCVIRTLLRVVENIRKSKNIFEEVESMHELLHSSEVVSLPSAMNSCDNENKMRI